MFEKFKINRKLLKELDFSVIIIAVLITLFGVMNIYSATHQNTYYPKLQIMSLILGLFVMYLILTIDYSTVGNYINIFYWAGIALLIVNDTMGHVSKGARSWIAIGSRTIQPSEFVKIILIITLAKKINDMESNINNSKNFLKLALYALLPMALILIQPDMGMTMVIFFIVLGIFFIAGLNTKIIFGGLTALVVAIALLWNSGLIEPYQKARLTSFINPQADQSDTGYQLTMSQIGIGSGGITGKGFLKGTQVAGGFIPEIHTDFIFSVVGEEWGLIGEGCLLIAYGILISKLLSIARNSKDIFGSIIVVGIISSFLFSILQNIGMTIGIMAISGITLPFMSYGGSSILTNYIALGLALNVGMRKKKINF